MKKIYETLIIFCPNVEPKTRDKYKKLFQSYSKEKEIIFNEMSVKQLTCKIRGFHKGYYIHCIYEAPDTAIAEIERQLRIDESVLKFLTVVSPESITFPDLKQTEQEKPDALDVLLGFANY